MQDNRFSGAGASVSTRKFESNDKIFIITLAVSLVLHAALLIAVLTVKLPTGITQDDYSQWVRRISDVAREAVVAPLEDEGSAFDGYQGNLPGAGDAPSPKSKPAGKTAKSSAPKGGAGGGPVKPVSSSGVLGVIGVASESGGDFADVFSSDAKVSDRVNDVMQGKKKAKTAKGGTQISRKKLGSDKQKGGAAGQTADIGDVGVSSGGKVAGGSKQNVAIRAPRVAVADTDVTSGLDKNSASSVISRKSSGFRRCYERALKANPSLRGKLVFEIAIGASGDVTQVKFVEDTLKASEVRDCIKSILRRLVFTRSGDNVAILKNTLVFEPQQ